MKSKKAAKTVTAIVLALALALSGTFAWQSISQQAVNEAQKTVNPGGRLHDDFSGYNDPLKNIVGKTKDIYVENFGEQPIYARIRLDEYMEIGDDANLMDITDPKYATRNANSLVAGAKKEDVTTWTTHLPDQDTPETDLKPQDNPFHKYWTWTMGGQDPENPDGQTVYMPTFNKNKDSLQADINGSWENERNIGGTFSAVTGGVGTVDKKGEPFADYTKWPEGVSADGGFDKKVQAGYTPGNELTLDDYKLPGEVVDADTNDVEETPFGAIGNSGTENTNWKAVTKNDDGSDLTHTAKKTETGSVVSMRDWLEMSEAERNALQAWVYDEDGWAYWSQPIEPGTATGLLLDSIELTNNPYMNWYYGINAVGQFITKDDIGNVNDTGFYDPNGGSNPSDNALTLLDYIGVNTSSVKGTVTTTATFTDEAGVAHMLDYAVAGMQKIQLNSTIGVLGQTPDQSAVEWTVLGAQSADTKIVEGTDADAGKWFLQVGADEPAGSVLLLTATSTQDGYDHLSGKLRLTVEEKSYSVKLSVDGGTRSVLPGSDHTLTAVLASNAFDTGLPQTFNWELVPRDPALQAGTTLAAGTSATTTLHTSFGETGKFTVKATVTGAGTGAAYASASGELTLNVTDVEFEMDLMDGTAYVTDTTVSMRPGEEKTFSIDLWSNPAVGTVPASAWTWTSSDASVATVDSTGKVTVVDTAGNGATAVITAKLTERPEVTAEFTVASWGIKINHGDTLLSNSTKEIVLGETITLQAELPAGYTVTSWSSSDDTVAAVDENGVVTVPANATPGATATITATASASTRAAETLTASFTVKAVNTVTVAGKAMTIADYSSTVTIDSINWYVCAVDEELKASDNTTHRAALLLASADLTQRRMGVSVDALWQGSELRYWLNNDWINDTAATIKNKAISVKIMTATHGGGTELDVSADKVFIPSTADFFGKTKDELNEDLDAQPEEYTYNGAILPNISAVTDYTHIKNIWSRTGSVFGRRGCVIINSNNEGVNRPMDPHFDGDRKHNVRPMFWYNLDS